MYYFRCIQYKYPSIEAFSPVVFSTDSNDRYQTVDLDSIKEFNHSYSKPFNAVKLTSQRVSLFYNIILSHFNFS